MPVISQERLHGVHLAPMFVSVTRLPKTEVSALITTPIVVSDVGQVTNVLATPCA